MKALIEPVRIALMDRNKAIVKETVRRERKAAVASFGTRWEAALSEAYTVAAGKGGGDGAKGNSIDKDQKGVGNIAGTENTVGGGSTGGDVTVSLPVSRIVFEGAFKRVMEGIDSHLRSTIASLMTPSGMDRVRVCVCVCVCVCMCECAFVNVHLLCVEFPQSCRAWCVILMQGRVYSYVFASNHTPSLLLGAIRH